MAREPRAPREKRAMPRWLWFVIIIVAAAIVIGGIIATYAVGGTLFG